VQWQVSTNGGSSWNNDTDASATSTTLTFTASAGQNGYEYRAVFTNSLNSATTTAATLTVDSAPVVTTQPSSTSVEVGSSASFTAAASGNPTPTVQWQVSTNGGSTWGNVAGATSGTYTFTTAEPESGYEYRALFTNTLAPSGVASNAATLTLTDQTSSNWSGYVAVNGTFSAVTASWTTPTVTCSSSTTYSAHWIGIDGDTSSTVEQDGSPSYDAWYEIYGDDSLDGGAEVELSPSTYPVKHGDAMSATVSVSGGDKWTLAISDATSPDVWSYSTQITFSGAVQSSAEWIAERPEVGSKLSSLADFGSVTFTAADATDASASGPISAFDYAPMEMLGTSNDVLAAPGALNGTGDGFTDTWQASK
jgi:hypothetical protein